MQIRLHLIRRQAVEQRPAQLRPAAVAAAVDGQLRGEGEGGRVQDGEERGGAVGGEEGHLAFGGLDEGVFGGGVGAVVVVVGGGGGVVGWVVVGLLLGWVGLVGVWRVWAVGMRVSLRGEVRVLVPAHGAGWWWEALGELVLGLVHVWLCVRGWWPKRGVDV
ncbi:hypothetical protein F5144DRAFT_582458 [Chaetomium tenue]|uniref:Uncharacterized protein n=1 Tax=Chaetomium tenue TaxID=1854479 RepID=A0ACB7NZT0_9PEZI|nr:hypothetical protein F5144DRAFT_582458 [Chaetomium globosum]